MSGSATGLRLETLMLGGGISASQLNTELGNSETLGKFKKMMGVSTSRALLLGDPLALGILLGSSIALEYLLQDPDTLGTWAADDAATAALFANVSSAIVVLSDPVKLAYWADNPTNWDRIQALENATGSVLRSQIFTSSGSWVVPATVAAYSAWGFADGGAGAGCVGSTDTYGGTGASGGEFGVKAEYETMPSGTITVTLGPGGTPGSGVAGGNGTGTTIGALLSLDPGLGGTRPDPYNAQPAPAGGGSNTGGGVGALTDTDVLTAPWQCQSLTVQGGEGAQNSSYYSGGSNGIGTPGAPIFTGSYHYGGGGTLGAGGASGSGATGAAYNGTAGTYGGGGGGALRTNTGGNTTGGAGGPGWAKIAWLEPVA